MTTVTDQTRLAVWGTLCDLEWNKRYYTAMAEQYRKRHRYVRFTILTGVAVEGGVLYAATVYPWLFYAGLAGGLLLAALTIWDAISNYAEDAAVLRLTALICDDLTQDTAELWSKIESNAVTTPEAEAAHQSIVRRWANATQRVQPETNHALNQKTYADANQDIANRYAV